MKIVILSGSPRKMGNTEIMTQAFANTVSKKHKVEIIPVANKKINGCIACKYCYAHDGVCSQQDDMTPIYESLKTADMVVFASPIYWFDITAQLKTVIDRMYAFGSVGFHFHKTALLLDAGADGYVFDAAIRQYKSMVNYLKWEDMGIITAPNMEKKGSMSECPELEKVKALAASI